LFLQAELEREREIRTYISPVFTDSLLCTSPLTLFVVNLVASTRKVFMPDIIRLFQAFLAPALFVSATALLILSINVRLMGIVSRLRQYVHAKHDAAKNDRVQEAEAYTEQINAIEQRAEIIRRCFMLVLISLAGTIAACLLLGFGVYWNQAALAAVLVSATQPGPSH
jgi:hypothetical protein